MLIDFGADTGADSLEAIADSLTTVEFKPAVAKLVSDRVKRPPFRIGQNTRDSAIDAPDLAMRTVYQPRHRKSAIDTPDFTLRALQRLRRHNG